MAISNDWTNKSLKIQQETEKAEAFQAGVMNALMMISKAHPPGELPPYVPPDKPSSPWEPGKSPAPSRQKLASTQIRPNQIMLPFVPKEAETDDMYGEGVDEVELKGLQAHGKYFDDDGRIKGKPRGMTPSGKPFDMPVDKEQQKKNKEMHIRKYHSDQAMNYPPPTERDKWLQLFQGPGGSLKHIKDPEMKKLILKRGAVRA